MAAEASIISHHAWLPYRVKKVITSLPDAKGKLSVQIGSMSMKLAASDLEEAILENKPLEGDLEKHAPWVAQLKQTHTFTPENTADILKEEVGKVFAKVLEHGGVYKRDPAGEKAFARFVEYVNR